MTFDRYVEYVEIDNRTLYKALDDSLIAEEVRARYLISDLIRIHDGKWLCRLNRRVLPLENNDSPTPEVTM